MEWWKKEQRFEEALQSGRASMDLWKYIPQSKAEAVEDTATDIDGYWIWLAEGYSAYDGGSDCGTIHEYTITDLRKAIKTIRKRGE